MLNVKQEKGKRIEGFENHYEISNFGRVSNFKKIMKTYKINSGYLCVKFTVNGDRTSHLIHRLVATAFVPNPNNLPVVNHIDGDKLNNYADNLEWVTNSENILHARKIGLNPYNTPSLGKKIGKGSKFHNVFLDTKRGKYMATVRHHKKNYYCKRFDTEKAAALHVNWILDTLGLHDRPRNLFN